LLAARSRSVRDLSPLAKSGRKTRRGAGTRQQYEVCRRSAWVRERSRVTPDQREAVFALRPAVMNSEKE
jgi:hypothetical protein